MSKGVNILLFYSKKTIIFLCTVLLLTLTSCKNNIDDFNNSKNVNHTAISISEETAGESIYEIQMTYIVNISTGKFHCTECPSVDQMSENNRRKYTGDRDDLISKGYVPCKKCKP